MRFYASLICSSLLCLMSAHRVVGAKQGAGEKTPSNMTKIVVRLLAPTLQKNAFSALPKTIYLAGPQFIRIEDPPDSRQGIQKLTVISGGDAYSVNLLDKKGTHASNAGGDNPVRLPIVLPFDPNHQFGTLDELEFGDELEFFKSAGARRSAGPIINARPTDAYTLSAENVTATLVVRSGTQTPVTLSWQQKSEAKWTYEYIKFDTVPFNPALFTKPSGIRYTEMPPDKDNQGE
jgi:hypothetical protein